MEAEKNGRTLGCPIGKNAIEHGIPIVSKQPSLTMLWKTVMAS
jgi:hypothetical protein